MNIFIKSFKYQEIHLNNLPLEVRLN